MHIIQSPSASTVCKAVEWSAVEAYRVRFNTTCFLTGHSTSACRSGWIKILKLLNKAFYAAMFLGFLYICRRQLCDHRHQTLFSGTCISGRCSVMTLNQLYPEQHGHNFCTCMSAPTRSYTRRSFIRSDASWKAWLCASLNINQMLQLGVFSWLEMTLQHHITENVDSSNEIKYVFRL